ncbi:hypothetical protein [Nonomuraea sp. B1E8]
MTAWRILLVTAAIAGLASLAASVGRPWAYFTVLGVRRLTNEPTDD